MREKIRKEIADFLKTDAAAVADERAFKADFGCDSVVFVQLLFSLEEIFGCLFEQADAYRFVTVGDVVSYVEQHATAH